MNKIIIIGNLGQDPEIKHLENITLANLSVAVSDFEKINGNYQKSTQWFKAVCFNKTAEFIHKNGKKGTKVMIEGKMKSKNYTDKNGIEKQYWEIISEKIELLTWNNSTENDSITIETNGQPFDLQF